MTYLYILSCVTSEIIKSIKIQCIMYYRDTEYELRWSHYIIGYERLEI